VLNALFTSASGMKAQQFSVDTIANNLANVNTNGFKRTQLSFQDLLYTDIIEPGLESSEGFQVPTGLQVGSGVRVAGSTKVFRQGDMEQTSRELDLAIGGRGFFQVTQPDGTTAYTRDGSFSLDSNRQIVTSDGKPLGSGLTVPSDATSINIGQDGKVYVVRAGSTDMSLAGEIRVANFPNPAGLKSIGGNLFQQTAASGTPTEHTAGQDGVGDVRQGYLERSNVEVVTELVKLITAQRAYEISTKAIKVSDGMLAKANEIAR